MKRLLAILASLLFAEAGYASGSELRHLTDAARILAARIEGQVRETITREMEQSGPLRAITAYKFMAPELVSALSRQNGVKIARVSLKPRNRGIGEPDAWEQDILLSFEKRAAKGEKAEAIEHFEIVQEPSGRYFRYMKAIPMQAGCLACHGSQISAAVKSMLAQEYPYDKATDVSVGQIRGAVSIKKPL
jgi:hypothetical protein